MHRSYARFFAPALTAAACALLGIALAPNARAQAPSPRIGADGAPLPDNRILIEWSQGAHDGPSYIVDHLDYIESLPFDGMVITPFLTSALFDPDPTGQWFQRGVPYWTYERISQSLDPITPFTFHKFLHNYVDVSMYAFDYWPDLFDETGWQNDLKSVRNMGRALAAHGIAGVMFDQEDYITWSWHGWAYPSSVAHPEKTLEQYIAQSRLRGRQTMKAFMKYNPGIQVLTVESPWLTCSTAPWYNWGDSILFGAFIMGMVEAVEVPAQVIDVSGGWSYRDPQDFADSYWMRRYGVPQARCKCSTAAINAKWSDTVTVGFNVGDWDLDNTPMSPAVTRSTLTNALNATDRIVWHFSMNQDWFAAPGDEGSTGWYLPRPTQEMIDAVAGARADSGLPPAGTR
ncbi:MAG: hypothetical protein JOZ62_07170 [Acidobacteriaceae bacterium]|nr:hypothetical protein [Acidobacteriaceae bacterium]